jgi:Tfp pilus assembly protein PilF
MSQNIAGESPAGLRPEHPGPAGSPRAVWTVCLLLALAVWIVFGQTLGHEFIIYDDSIYVYENPTVTQGLTLHGAVWAFTHVYHIVWFPVTTLSHMLDWQFYGDHPAGHHFTNVLLHTVVVILLFLVLREMTGALWRCAFVAAVFAIHPLRVESVAWVAERKDVLSGLFFMLTLWAYVRYTQWSKVQGPKSKVWYGVAMGVFALGLMSKTMLVTLPLVLLLLDFWPLRRVAGVRRLLLEKVPFAVLAVAAGVVTLVAQSVKFQQVEKLSLAWRAGDAMLAYVDYIQHLLWPANLTMLYAHPGLRLPALGVALATAALLIITADVVAVRRKLPYLLVGWLWYLGMLVPVIGLMQAGDQARADRYTYLPQIGLAIMLAWGAADLFGNGRYKRVVLGSAAAVIIAALMAAAYVQTGYWKDDISLWTHTLACTPNNVVARNQLGSALKARGQLDGAIHQYTLAIQSSPKYATSHVNLGLACMAQGRLDDAMQQFQTALELDPNYVDAQNNLGLVLAAKGKFPEAVRHYQQALQSDPYNPKFHYNLGIALAAQGELDKAIQQYKQALAIDPNYAKAHNNLGNALVKQGNLDEAAKQYDWALDLDPGYLEAHYNLANILADHGVKAEAIDHYQKALDLAVSQNKTALAETIRTQLQKLDAAK